jgi:hypothetical protein
LLIKFIIRSLAASATAWWVGSSSFITIYLYKII